VTSATAKKGVVLSQSRRAGSVLAAKTKIGLVVGEGRKRRS
jgi:beta-lactam-binding protein with PASTA domain